MHDLPASPTRSTCSRALFALPVRTPTPRRNTEGKHYRRYRAAKSIYSRFFPRSFTPIFCPPFSPRHISQLCLSWSPWNGLWAGLSHELSSTMYVRGIARFYCSPEINEIARRYAGYARRRRGVFEPSSQRTRGCVFHGSSYRILAIRGLFDTSNTRPLLLDGIGSRAV